MKQSNLLYQQPLHKNDYENSNYSNDFGDIVLLSIIVVKLLAIKKSIKKKFHRPSIRHLDEHKSHQSEFIAS